MDMLRWCACICALLLCWVTLSTTITSLCSPLTARLSGSCIPIGSLSPATKMLLESSYRCNSIGSIWSEWPVGLRLPLRLRSSHPYYHGRHVCCSLPSVHSDSEGFEEEQGSKFKIEDDNETNAPATMEDEDRGRGSSSEHQRAKPKNPRLRIGKITLQDFTKSLEDKLQAYEEESKPALLFTSEERYALNRSRPDFEKLSSEKWPLLHTLAISGDSFYVDRLLKQNVDVNALDKDGYSALQRAVLARKETIVNQLLRAQADVTVCDNGGATLLHYSIQTGSMNLVRSFLHCGVDVNSSDKYGWTPLHLAVLTGRADIVRLLLMSGADKTLRNKDGLTALDLCFSLGRGFNSIEVAKGLKRFPKEKPTIGMA